MAKKDSNGNYRDDHGGFHGSEYLADKANEGFYKKTNDLIKAQAVIAQHQLSETKQQSEILREQKNESKKQTELERKRQIELQKQSDALTNKIEYDKLLTFLDGENEENRWEVIQSKTLELVSAKLFESIIAHVAEKSLEIWRSDPRLELERSKAKKLKEIPSELLKLHVAFRKSVIKLAKKLAVNPEDSVQRKQVVDVARDILTEDAFRLLETCNVGLEIYEDRVYTSDSPSPFKEQPISREPIATKAPDKPLSNSVFYTIAIFNCMFWSVGIAGAFISQKNDDRGIAERIFTASVFIFFASIPFLVRYVNRRKRDKIIDDIASLKKAEINKNKNLKLLEQDVSAIFMEMKVLVESGNDIMKSLNFKPLSELVKNYNIPEQDCIPLIIETVDLWQNSIPPRCRINMTTEKAKEILTNYQPTIRLIKKNSTKNPSDSFLYDCCASEESLNCDIVD